MSDLDKRTDLKSGDFIEQTTGGTPSVGIMTINENVAEGDPLRFLMTVGLNGKAMILAGYPGVFQSVVRKLETPAEQREAVENERRQGVLKAAAIFRATNEKAAWLLSGIDHGTDEMPSPGTGVFIVRGVYAGRQLSPTLALVLADPGTTPDDLSAKLRLYYTGGFSAIPYVFDNNPLVAYECFELPPQALALIDWEPIKIPAFVPR